MTKIVVNLIDSIKEIFIIWVSSLLNFIGSRRELCRITAKTRVSYNEMFLTLNDDIGKFKTV